MSQAVVISAYVGIALLVAVGGLLLSFLCAPKGACGIRGVPYECGMHAIHNPGDSINSRFYFYGLLFLIFDVELIFLIPWALSLDGMAFAGFAAGMLFIASLVVAFVYELRKGALSCR